MGEQRGFAPLLTVDLASVTVELNLCESGARFPCKWSSVLEIYSQYADEDGEKGAEDVTVDSTTEPSQMFYHERRLKILYEAFDDLEYRERSIVAEHLGFCENCWSPYYIEIINGRKVKRKFEKIAFIDLAGEHGVVPSSADRIYREAR